MHRAAAFVAAAAPLPRTMAPRRAAAACAAAAPRPLPTSSFAPGGGRVRAHARRGAVAPAHAAARRAAPAVSASAKQMDTEWNTVRVMENTVVCEEHRYFVVNVGTTAETGSLCDAYRVPGMYVQVREGEGGKPGFFALSCAPNIQGVFEFLVKETEGTAWLAAKRAGDSVQMSPIMGKGFPISTRLQLLAYPALPEERAPTDIIMFATGSGIAPIRAAIESRLNGVNPAQRKSVKLYYGARYPERMAYRDRFKLWESDRVEVIPVMSRPEGAKEPWTGRTGYVQDAFRADGIANPAKTGVILCGVKGMVEDVTKICLDAGVDKDRILTNF